MERDYRFDVARVICMTYIVAFLHLYGYIYDTISANVIPWCRILCDSCLGLFTFISGYLLGKKYNFGTDGSRIKDFYFNRVIRIIPLFLLASLALWLIGFNSAKATINGILCLSPFVSIRPMTLWYIPVIIICYLITPLVCRYGFIYRVAVSLCVILLVMVIGVIRSIDYRFIFNLLFYLLGLVTAPYLSWRFPIKAGIYIKCLVVIVFIIALVFCRYLSYYQKIAVSSLGTFAVLFACETITNKILPKGIKKNDNRDKHALIDFVKHVSYASMVVYMFHRLFFWVGESLWNPANTTIKWIYMAGVVFPIMIVISYYIQFVYDWLVKKVIKQS